MELLRPRWMRRARCLGSARVSITLWRLAVQTTGLWRQNSSGDLLMVLVRWSRTLGAEPETPAVVTSMSRTARVEARPSKTIGTRAPRGDQLLTVFHTSFQSPRCTSFPSAKERSGSRADRHRGF